jgi:hypothetical protein
MKSRSQLSTLAAVQLSLAVVLAALCALHIYYTAMANRQALRLHRHNVNRQAFEGLVRESFQYGNASNRAIIRALAESGLVLDLSTNTPSGKPASKP